MTSPLTSRSASLDDSASSRRGTSAAATGPMTTGAEPSRRTVTVGAAQHIPWHPAATTASGSFRRATSSRRAAIVSPAPTAIEQDPTPTTSLVAARPRCAARTNAARHWVGDPEAAPVRTPAVGVETA